MKLAIFGATGKTGQILLAQALAAGHTVTALARNPAKLVPQPNLRVVAGDVQNQTAVDETLAGTEAVLNVLGHTRRSPRDLQAVATRNIVTAMQRLGIKRLVTLTGAGVRDPHDQPKAVDKFFGFLLKTFSPKVIADAKRQVIFMQASATDWIIVRAPRLSDGPRTGVYKVGYVGPDSGIQISRADVADFMLKQISDPAYVHQMPMISY
jgi:putative NADH-flavin reductase